MNEKKEETNNEEAKMNKEEKRKASEGEQEKLMNLSLLEQEANQINQQLQIIEQQMIELQILKLHLDDIEKTKEKEEILASIGRNMFIQTSLSSREIFVDVGAKTVLKKTPQEAKRVVDMDIERMTELRNKIMNELERISKEASCISV